MSQTDFEQTKAIFTAALKGIRNDESLGDWLVELGASLVALGVQENKRRHSEPGVTCAGHPSVLNESDPD